MRGNPLVLILMLMSSSVIASDAADGLVLDLSRRGGEIYVVLSNHGDEPVKVRTDYLLERLFGSLSFDIRRGGTTYPETAHINPALPGETNYIVLSPGQIGGQLFRIETVRSMHSLSKGCYVVTATYHDSMAKDFSAFSSYVRSNAIDLCIAEKGKGK